MAPPPLTGPSHVLPTYTPTGGTPPTGGVETALAKVDAIAGDISTISTALATIQEAIAILQAELATLKAPSPDDFKKTETRTEGTPPQTRVVQVPDTAAFNRAMSTYLQKLYQIQDRIAAKQQELSQKEAELARKNNELAAAKGELVKAQQDEVRAMTVRNRAFAEEIRQAHQEQLRKVEEAQKKALQAEAEAQKAQEDLQRAHEATARMNQAAMTLGGYNDDGAKKLRDDIKRWDQASGAPPPYATANSPSGDAVKQYQTDTSQAQGIATAGLTSATNHLPRLENGSVLPPVSALTTEDYLELTPKLASIEDGVSDDEVHLTIDLASDSSGPLTVQALSTMKSAWAAAGFSQDEIDTAVGRVIGPQSYRSMSQDEQQDAVTVLERSRTDAYALVEWLQQHPDPREQARMFDLAASFHMLGSVLDRSGIDDASRRVIAEGLANSFASGSLSDDEFASSIAGSGRGEMPGRAHENLAALVVATGNPSIIESFVKGEINVLGQSSEDVIRLPSIAIALSALPAGDHQEFMNERPDIKAVMDIYRRHRDMKAAGLHYNDTDLFDSVVAIQTVLSPENRQVIDQMASKYGVSPALLAGVVAAEIDFDRDRKDVVLDRTARNTGVAIGQGWGVTAVHGDSLDKAIAYMKDNQLPGWQDAQKYNKDVGYKASFDGSVEAAAIVLAWLADVKQKNGGTVNSPEDMAVIWGAYRTGVVGVSPDAGGYASAADFARNKAAGTEAYPPQFAMGGNAYQSQPYFEYFSSLYPAQV